MSIQFLIHQRATTTILFALIGLALSSSLLATNDPFNLWINRSEGVAIHKIVQNSSKPDALPGTIVASPSRSHPDYYFHWTRDASLTALTMVRMLESDRYDDQKSWLLNTLKSFALLSRQHQQTPSQGGFGEPKFYVNGEPFTGPWGRPQNDGPALRSLAMTRFANILLDNGFESFVRSVLYDNQYPSKSVIKSDLEYLSLNWHLDDFDLWEEVRGQHLFTRVSQAKAFEEGSDLAMTLGDPEAAFWYRMQAGKIRATLQNFGHAQSGLVLTTINRSGGINYKSGLDASLLLAILIESQSGALIGLNTEWTDHTISELKRQFIDLYAVNHLGTESPGIAMGRYPEDTYDGYQTGQVGNPWFILTLALGEYHFLKAKALCAFMSDANNTALISDHLKKGNAQLQRVRQHQDSEFRMDEQFNRHHGYMQGARDLTWSYTSLINTILSRSEAYQACNI